MNEPVLGNRIGQLTPDLPEFQPESLESRAQLDGFIREAFQQRRIPYEIPHIHVVDDDAGFRNGVIRQLKATGFMAHGYPDAPSFLGAKIENRPGCILLDCVLPGTDGLEMHRELRRRLCPLPVIFMSGEGSIAATVEAMKAGAMDFLTKPVKTGTLLTAIRNAVGQYIDKRTELEQAAEWREAFATLTCREREVMTGVIAGKPNKVIAAEMGITLRTAKAHRGKVMEKMGVVSVAELVQIAIKLKAISG